MEINNQIVQVKVEDIEKNRFQPRIQFDEKDIEEMAESISQFGIIQPLTLRPTSNNKYELITGERRYRAAKKLELKTVPAIIMDIDDSTSAELALIENIQRKNLNAIEEAKAFKQIIDMTNITQEELSHRIGKKQSTIANKIRLLKLPEEIQDLVLNKKISERHARTLLKLNNSDVQKEIAEIIINEKLTVKSTENLISSEYNDYLENSEKENLDDIYVDFRNIILNNAKEENIGDEIKMNQENINQIMQPAQPGVIPETPIPTQPEPQAQPNNNFFPSLEDQQTNMNLNPWSTPESPQAEAPAAPEQPMNVNPTPQAPVNPWEEPTQGNVQQPMAPDANMAPSMQPSVSPEVQMANPVDNSQLMPQQNLMDSNQPMAPVADQTTIMPGQPLNTEINNELGTQPQLTPNNQPMTAEAPVAAQPETPANNEPVVPVLGNMPQPSSDSPSIPLAPEQSLWNTEAPVVVEQPSEQAENQLPGSPAVPTEQPAAPTQPGAESSALPSFIEQSAVPTIEQQTPQAAPAGNDITESITKVRNTVSEIEASGHKVQSSEVDLDTEYQFVIKIQK